jgi:uncharacterized protein (DUF1697 family)
MLEGAVMPTYVALLRAVNVPNSTKLSMAEFRKLLEGLGYKRVETYIQSGNAVFDAPVPAAKTAKAIAAALEKLMGGPVGVLLRTHVELGRVIAGNPYASEAAADGARVHAVFLSGIPVEAAIAGLKKIPPRSDRYHHLGDTLYLHLPDGAAESKFTAKTLDRILGVNVTARNWNTVVKLHEMSRR